MAAYVTITGDKKLDRIFNQLPKRMQNKIIRDVIKEKMQPMLSTARALVPVDEGDLKNALKIRAMRRRRGHVGRSLIVDAKRLNRAGDESAAKRLAGAFQEYGFTARDGTEVPPQAFMKPAFDRHEDNIRQQGVREIGQRAIAEAKRM